MNVYDTANKLAQEIKQAPEYLEYKKAKEKINQNPKTKAKIEEFEKARYEAQVLSIQSGVQDPEKLKKVQELYAELVQNEEVKTYFDLEMKFNVMLADVNKIIGESIKDLF